jgi:antitoxin CptB
LSDGRIRWQCRRGTRELDRLLTVWFDASYGSADDRHKSAFRALLELQDPELIAYLLHGVRPADPAISEVIDAIRRAN